MQKIIRVIIFIISINKTNAQNIDIGLFYGKNISAITFTSLEGKYEIQNNGEIKDEIKQDEIAYITVINGYMQVRKKDNYLKNKKTWISRRYVIKILDKRYTCSKRFKAITICPVS